MEPPDPSIESRLTSIELLRAAGRGTVDSIPAIVAALVSGAVPPEFTILTQVASTAASTAFISAAGVALAAVGGQRQRERAVATAYMSIAAIADRVERGEERRPDEFYCPNELGRSEGEEFIEGALHIAAGTYEERKLAIISSLIANVDMRESITGHDAQFALLAVDRLTYAQLCLLAMCGVSAPRPDEPIPQGTQSLIGQLEVLADEGLVGIRQDDGHVAHYSAVLNGGTLRRGLTRVSLTQKGDNLVGVLNLTILASQSECHAVWRDLLNGK
jgi:hypothetical protein